MHKLYKIFIIYSQRIKINNVYLRGLTYFIENCNKA